jgi:putative ABC transport system permease protein
VIHEHGQPAPTRSRTVAHATRLYATALRLLPRHLRANHGSEVIACFRQIAEQVRRDSGRMLVLGILVLSLADLVVRAPREHLARRRADVRADGGWGGTLLDVRHAQRRLLRRPGFAVAAVLTLAVGMAGATAVFSLVYGVVLSPLPYPQSDRIVVIDHSGSGISIEEGLGVTYGFFRFYEARVRSTESMATYVTSDETLTGSSEPVRVPVARTTAALGSVLGVAPALGRWLVAADAEEGAPETVVVSDRVWRDRFGGDPGLIGTTIQLSGSPRTVVGVMPAGFGFPNENVEFWTPLAVPETGIGGWNQQAVARLAPGRTPEGLEREMASLLPILRQNNDDPALILSYLDEAKILPRIVTLKESLVGNVRAMLWVLLGTVGIVLVIAVGNVANLFLVRAEEGRREAAVRTALGARRGQVVRGFMLESLFVTLAASAAGIVLASIGVRLLRLRAPIEIPRLAEVGMDPAVVAAAIGTAIVTALIIGLIPSLRTPASLPSALKEGSSRSTSGRERMRRRNALVAIQVALALMLLIGSGLLFRTFQQLRAVELGFTTRQALTFELGLPSTRYGDPAAMKAFHESLLEELRALPGVEAAAAIAQCLPLTPNMCWGEIFEAEGYPTPEGSVPPVTGARLATADYFSSIGIAVRGRTFDASDGSAEPRVAILSESAANAYFGSDDPLGGRIRITDSEQWYTIVGVASDVQATISTDEFQRLIYLPLTPVRAGGPSPAVMRYVLRTAVPPTALVPAVRGVVADADPLIPLADALPLRQIIDEAAGPTAFALTLIGIAALTALLLGAIGLYAVLAYVVSGRTREIGLRMALGATAADVRRLVLRQGIGVVLGGVVAGWAGAIGLTRFMRGMLHGVSATDPLSYAVVTLILLGVAGVALYLPARRASSVDPAEAFRTD